jgi:cyclophilin family peptidyl-prolyl cis-trans isomerase
MKSVSRHARRCGLLLLIAAAGCGSSSQPPTASINAQREERLDDTDSPTRKGPQPFPQVRLRTSLGDITLRLDREAAPLTVDNFLAYADRGHYDQTIFHQVVQGYIVMGGGYTAQFEEKEADYPIRNEAHRGLPNRRGTIAMLRDPAVIDSSTSQFFINLADNPGLDYRGDSSEDYGYCAFGEVTDGMDVVEKIAGVEVADRNGFEKTPVKPVLIRSVERVD